MPLNRDKSAGLERATATEQVYEAMIEELVSGRLHRNERLQERELAEYFNISRTPLREAIRKLEHDGFLISMPYRGVFVRDYTKKEVEALFELRIELEAMAARLAASLATPEEIELMKKSIQVYKQTPLRQSLDLSIRSTAELHIIIGRASQNPWLLRIIYQMQIHSSLLRHQSHLDPKRRKLIIQEHNDLVNAIETANPEEAERIIRKHLESAREFVIEHVFSAA